MKRKQHGFLPLDLFELGRPIETPEEPPVLQLGLLRLEEETDDSNLSVGIADQEVGRDRGCADGLGRPEKRVSASDFWFLRLRSSRYNGFSVETHRSMVERI